MTYIAASALLEILVLLAVAASLVGCGRGGETAQTSPPSRGPVIQKGTRTSGRVHPSPSQSPASRIELAAEQAAANILTTTDAAGCRTLVSYRFLTLSYDTPDPNLGAALCEAEIQADAQTAARSISIKRAAGALGFRKLWVAPAGGIGDGQVLKVLLSRENGDWLVDQVTGLTAPRKLVRRAASLTARLLERRGRVDDADIDCTVRLAAPTLALSLVPAFRGGRLDRDVTERAASRCARR